MVFVGMNKEKPALRTGQPFACTRSSCSYMHVLMHILTSGWHAEGLLSAKNIVDIIQNELT